MARGQAGVRPEGRLTGRSERRYTPKDLAWWRSGYAAACKAVYTGSIPVQASTSAPGDPQPRLLSGRRTHQTAKRRRPRRTQGMSTDKTTSPSGSIQKPTTGRKPSTPPSSRPTPRAIRKPRLRGNLVRCGFGRFILRPYNAGPGTASVPRRPR